MLYNLAGQDNDSLGFRDNRTIKSNFTAAKAEIETPTNTAKKK